MESSLGPVLLGVRSCFSLGEGVLSPEEICLAAARSGYRAVAVADRNNLYGLIRFLWAAEERGLKPVIASRLEIGGTELAQVYVKEEHGFARLNRLLTHLLMAPTRPRLLDCGQVGPENEKQAGLYENLVADLLEHGWEGLCLVSAERDFLKRLSRLSREGLFVKLCYGRPWASLAAWARAERLKTLAVVDALACNRADAEVYQVLRAIALGRNLAGLGPRERLKPSQFLPTSVSFKAFFRPLPEALANAEELALQAESGFVLKRPPSLPVLDGLKPEEAFARLKALCRAGIVRRYGVANPTTEERLAYELAVVREKGFASYFLVVHDIVSHFPRTCGRGSAASSLISYLLGLTQVDPLRYDLFFERFLNRSRQDPPDIDLDFPWDERPKALDYVFSRYAGQSGLVADHICFGPRLSLREPAKAWGLDEAEIKKLVRFYLWGEEDLIPAPLLTIALRLRSLPRHLGTHPGGVVISPTEITNYTHLWPSAAGYPVIAWEKEGTEAAGLVKIDLLGNRSLSVFRDCIKSVAERHGPLDLGEAFNPFKDSATQRLIATGNTLGIFYIESPATRQLLAQMRRGDYDNLIIASSIIRPAARRYIREFVRRLHTGVLPSLHPVVDKILAGSLGIMVYQEDVVRVAMALANFSVDEAEKLRKALAQKSGTQGLAPFKSRFIAGALARGASLKSAEAIWEMVLSFRGYSFCKAHSASYAQLSYQLAYLKCHYPLEFFAAVINNGGGFYSRQGLGLLLPDVNQSELLYTIEGNALRVGLLQLRRVSLGFLTRLLALRRADGPFRDFRDFLVRTRPHLPELSAFIRSGALDTISHGLTRPQLFYLYFQEERLRSSFFPELDLPALGDYAEGVKLRDELDTLGLFVSCHPVSVFRPRLAKLAPAFSQAKLITSVEITSQVGKTVALAGLLVSGKEAWTAAEEPMMFVSFEDEAGLFETVFRPAVFKKYRALLATASVFLIVGRVRAEFGVPSIVVTTLKRLSRSPDLLGEAQAREISWG